MKWMPKNAKYIIVDYNDLVLVPDIEVMFTEENPDRIFDAFSRAIKEALQTRFPDYAEKIKDEVRVRLVNYPSERSLDKLTLKQLEPLQVFQEWLLELRSKTSCKRIDLCLSDEHKPK